MYRLNGKDHKKAISINTLFDVKKEIIAVIAGNTNINKVINIVSLFRLLE